MPHSTFSFAFEWKILSWATSLSFSLTGSNRGLLLLSDSAGAFRQIYTGEHSNHFDLELKQRFTRSERHWLFYHPFEAPEYTWVEWEAIPVESLERLIGKSFEPADLISSQTKESIQRVPTSWGVMF